MILEAFFIVAERQGIHAVSLRSVAAEAGVSLRLVQYYFETKAGLMRSGLAHLESLSNERLKVRIQSFAQFSNSLATLKALFDVALPSDDESRKFHLLWTSYALLSMTDPAISDQTFVEGPSRLQEWIASVLEEGKAKGEIGEQIDSRTESLVILALLHGLGTAVLIGQQTLEAASLSFRYHIDRLGVFKSEGDKAGSRV